MKKNLDDLWPKGKLGWKKNLTAFLWILTHPRKAVKLVWFGAKVVFHYGVENENMFIDGDVDDAPFEIRAMWESNRKEMK